MFKKGFAPGMPVRTVSTFIPPVAAKFHIQSCQDLSPLHIHTFPFTKVVPSHSVGSTEVNGPRHHKPPPPSPPPPPKVNNNRHATRQGLIRAPPTPNVSPITVCQSPNLQKPSCDGRMEASTITTFIPVKRDPNAKDNKPNTTKLPPRCIRWRPRRRAANPKGPTTPWRPPSSSRGTRPQNPSPPTVSKRPTRDR